MGPDVNDLTRALQAAPPSDTVSAEQLLPLVYEELRRLASAKMSGEAGPHTLQPTALVHEAWLRLFGDGASRWQNRAHFFGAAAEAMRRILVDHARRKQSQKRGGGVANVELDEEAIVLDAPPDELLAIHDAVDLLAARDPQAAELVKLRYFVGLTMDEAAETLSLPKRTAEGLWTYARIWLHRTIRRADPAPGTGSHP